MTEDTEPVKDYIAAMATIERQVPIAKRAVERSDVDGEQLEALMGVLDEMEMVASDIKTACNATTREPSPTQK